MKVITGVTLRAERIHSDSRGDLVVFEQFRNLPFACKRVFAIKADRADVVRGGHASTSDEVIIALSGSVLVEVDNGKERGSARLSRCDQALRIKPGIVVTLREFEPQTVLLVCASRYYDETKHFDQPQTQLLDAI